MKICNVLSYYSLIVTSVLSIYCVAVCIIYVRNSGAGFKEKGVFSHLEMDSMLIQAIAGISVLALSIFSSAMCRTDNCRLSLAVWIGACGIFCFQCAEFHIENLIFVFVTLGFILLWTLKIYFLNKVNISHL